RGLIHGATVRRRRCAHGPFGPGTTRSDPSAATLRARTVRPRSDPAGPARRRRSVRIQQRRRCRHGPGPARAARTATELCARTVRPRTIRSGPTGGTATPTYRTAPKPLVPTQPPHRYAHVPYDAQPSDPARPAAPLSARTVRPRTIPSEPNSRNTAPTYRTAPKRLVRTPRRHPLADDRAVTIAPPSPTAPARPRL